MKRRGKKVHLPIISISYSFDKMCTRSVVATDYKNNMVVGPKLQFNTLKHVSKLELGFRYTFPTRAKLWNMLIKPYEVPMKTSSMIQTMRMSLCLPMLDQEQNPEESIVRYCRQKNKLPFDDDSSDLQERGGGGGGRGRTIMD